MQFFKYQKPPTFQEFLSGSGTYTPPSGCVAIEVLAVGPGGGGSGSGTTGAGGTSTAGTAATTFGSITCNPGAGCASNGASNGGAGGSASLGADFTGIARTGQNGGGNALSLTNCYIPSGAGGSTPLGGGGAPACAGTNGIAGIANTGSGGSGGGPVGAAATNVGGGGGAGGYVLAYRTSPVAVSYSIGAGGTKGAVGSGSGFTGGDGASGYIRVKEYY